MHGPQWRGGSGIVSDMALPPSTEQKKVLPTKAQPLPTLKENATVRIRSALSEVKALSCMPTPLIQMVGVYAIDLLVWNVHSRNASVFRCSAPDGRSVERHGKSPAGYKIVSFGRTIGQMLEEWRAPQGSGAPEGWVLTVEATCSDGMAIGLTTLETDAVPVQWPNGAATDAKGQALAFSTTEAHRWMGHGSDLRFGDEMRANYNDARFKFHVHDGGDSADARANSRLTIDVYVDQMLIGKDICRGFSDIKSWRLYLAFYDRPSAVTIEPLG
jgi:hypothetical protein